MTVAMAQRENWSLPAPATPLYAPAVRAFIAMTAPVILAPIGLPSTLT